MSQGSGVRRIPVTCGQGSDMSRRRDAIEYLLIAALVATTALMGVATAVLTMRVLG